MNLMKVDLAEVELRATADVTRQLRQQNRKYRIGILVGRVIMWIGVVGLVVSLLFLFVGCATLVHGPTQEIPVTSDPPGAVVTPTDYKRFAYTPGVIVLDRNQGTTLTAKLYGYEDCTIEIKCGVSPWFFGNVVGILSPVTFFSNHVPGVAVLGHSDASSIGDLSPKSVHFEMIKK